MNPVLTALGITEDIQSFFGSEQLLFTYGAHYEHYETDFHRVPTTPHLWMAGDVITREVIITPAAMEAIAYLSLNRRRHRSFSNLTFIALGNLPHDGQLNWIRKHLPQRKYTIVFPNDLLGRLADIRIAAALKGISVSFRYLPAGIEVQYNRLTLRFGEDTISLSSFEKAASLRTGCRTVKAKQFNTFLEQLKNEQTT